MKRREFLKLGAATLASLWLVKPGEVKAAEGDLQEEGPPKEKNRKESPLNCENCFRYFCGPGCPHWWDRPYFVAGSCHRVMPKLDPDGCDPETYYHVSDLGIEADRNPSPEYREWKEVSGS